jgi:hypothetical protein
MILKDLDKACMQIVTICNLNVRQFYQNEDGCEIH